MAKSPASAPPAVAPIRQVASAPVRLVATTVVLIGSGQQQRQYLPGEDLPAMPPVEVDWMVANGAAKRSEA